MIEFNLLGKKVVDCVTQMEGVVTAVSFDLYGHKLALINPGMNKDGKLDDLVWVDISRLLILSPQTVMEPPVFYKGE